MTKPHVYKTKAEAGGRPIMIEVKADRIEMWRMGARNRRVAMVDKLWIDCLFNPADPPTPPQPGRRTNRIIAYFVGVRRGHSYWKRVDTGEEMTEAALNKAGRKEKRKVVALYGMPQAQHIEEWRRHSENKVARVGVRAAGRSGGFVLDGQGDRVVGRVDEEDAW